MKVVPSASRGAEVFAELSDELIEEETVLLTRETWPGDPGTAVRAFVGIRSPVNEEKDPAITGSLRSNVERRPES